MARSTFSPIGLPFGENKLNMTYLYGLSDFFSIMFEDPGKLNLLLEAGAEKASEIYSKFLQLSSTISLTDIQKTSGETLKLVIIKSSDAIPGEVNVYKLPANIVSSRYVANRPFLPTALLEESVDYRIETTTSGELRIRFAKDISSAGFSTRLLSDEVTKEYAIWFVDAEIDEQWISTYYGSLIGLTPESSTETFKNYVYGLYYVYANGPTLDLLRKGLNLTLGIPLARTSETVLEVRKYLETDQYVVITDSNQYVIPYGLPAAVEEGQLLSTSDEIARWIEVKDYVNDGDWWVNLQIPSSIIPSIPPGQSDRYATQGSHYDYLMRTYLKKHTFLVNVNVTVFKDNQIFNELSDVIKRAKPSYTQAVYIWTVEKDELISIDDSALRQVWSMARCDNISTPVHLFNRTFSNSNLKRGCPQFIRFNITDNMAKIGGINDYRNGYPSDFYDGTITGFINYRRQLRSASSSPSTEAMESNWMNIVMDRASDSTRNSRSKIVYGMRTLYETYNPANLISRKARTMMQVPEGMRVVPLYITVQADIEDKCKFLGIDVPGPSEWVFDIMNPDKITSAINALAINEGLKDTDYLNIRTHFDLLFNRGENYSHVSNMVPETGKKTWKPDSPDDVSPTDYILGVRIFDEVLGLYWITRNTKDYSMLGMVVNSEEDVLEMTMDSRPNRGMAIHGSSFYNVRGRGTLNYEDDTAAGQINAHPINDQGDILYSSVGTKFSDKYNDNLVMNRSGTTKLRHFIDDK